MRITFLGTGSIIPTPKRYSSSILLELRDERILMDCGPGTVEKLKRIGCNPSTITRILITHYHIDHVLDLLAILKVRRFNPLGGAISEVNRLTVIGPRGLNEFLRFLLHEFPYFRYLSENLHCYENVSILEAWDGLVLDEGKLKIFTKPVKHYNGVAYRIEVDGKSIVYSGDAFPDKNLIDLSKGSDVLIHECSFPSNMLLGLHTSERELIEVLKEAKPKTVFIIHLYPAWEGREDELLSYVSRVFKGNVVIPSDLESFEI